MGQLGRNDKDKTTEILKKPTYDGQCMTDFGLQLLFYPDCMIIDFGDMNHYVHIENKYMSRMIKLMENHLKRYKES